MKKTMLATAIALSLCLPVYAAGQLFNNVSQKYDSPDFGDNTTIETDKAENKQLKEDKKSEAMPIRVRADHAEYDPASGDFHASGNVVIKQGMQSIKTSYANGNMKTGDIWAEKGAELTDPATNLKGSWGHYNLNTKTGELKEITGKSQKDYVNAPHAVIMPDKLLLDQGGKGSRCPAVLHPPCLSIEAKTIEFYPNEKVVAKDVKVFARGKHIYSRDIWVNRFNNGTQTKIMPRVGFDDSENGAYIKMELEQPLDKYNSFGAEVVQYSKSGFKPQYFLDHDSRHIKIKYFHGWDEDDDKWYKKQNDIRFDFKPHHLIEGIPLRISSYYERGLWNQEYRPNKSWHSEYAVYLHHDPIYLFNTKNTVLNATIGKKWVHESVNHETKRTNLQYYTLGHKFSEQWRTWVGYYREGETTNLFELGQPDMKKEIRNGLQYSPDTKNVFTVVNRYDCNKHERYETDYRWLHKFCCWALEISYEREWKKQDHSFKVHYYFYNW